MIKYEPSIIIWKLRISDKDDGGVYQDIYFLFHKMAERFLKMHEEELKDLNVSIAGEQLWLW